MTSFKDLIENSETRAGRVFDLCINAVIVLSLMTFSLETLPSLSGSVRQWLWYAEVMTVAIFTVEYLARVIVADRKLAYIFSFYGLVDILAVLPFYLSTGIDLRSLRVLRLLRLFRTLKMVRYSRAIRRLRLALQIAREELVMYGCVTVLLLYLSAVGVYYFENQSQPDVFSSVFHSFWWAVVTLTTVGYGDMYPVTAGGKAFTIVILLIGLGIVAVPSGLLASALTEAREMDE